MGHTPTTKRKRGKHRPQCPCTRCVERREVKRIINGMPSVFLVEDKWGKRDKQP